MNKKYQAILLSFVLLSSVFSLNSAYAQSGSGTTISLSTEESFKPKVAASGNNVYVVWQENQGEGMNSVADIFIARSDDSEKTFSEPDNLSDNSGRSSIPQVAAAGSNVYVVWEDGTPGNAEVFFAKSTDSGASFSDAENISNTVSLSSNPMIALTGSSGIAVVWTESLSLTNFEIFAITSDDGGQSFGDVMNVSDNDKESRAASVASVGEDIYLVWQDATSGNLEIMLAKSSDGGSSFDDPVNVSNTAGKSSAPQIAASGDNISVLWQEDTKIRLAGSADGGSSFGSAKTLGQADSLLKPQIAASGNSVFVASGENDDIMLVRSSDSGASLGSSINISNNDGVSSTPAIAVSGNNIYLAWQDSTSGNSDIFFTYSTDSGVTFLPIGTEAGEEEIRVPGWFKSNAQWWSQGLISDAEVIAAIEHLISEKVINIGKIKATAASSKAEAIPDFVKNTFEWWSEDMVSDSEIANSISYLIEKNIIRSEKLTKQYQVEQKIDPKILGKVYTTMQWNNVAMKQLVKIKEYEAKLVKDEAKTLWAEYSKTNDKAVQIKATKIQLLEPVVKNKAIDSAKISKAVQSRLAEIEQDAKDAGVAVDALRIKSTNYDQIKDIKSDAQYKEAVKNFDRAEAQASASLKDVLGDLGFDESKVPSYKAIAATLKSYDPKYLPSKDVITPKLGGAIASADGKLMLKFVPGAVAQNTIVSIEKIPEEKWPKEVKSGGFDAFYRINPDQIKLQKKAILDWFLENGDLIAIDLPSNKQVDTTDVDLKVDLSYSDDLSDLSVLIDRNAAYPVGDENPISYMDFMWNIVPDINDLVDIGDILDPKSVSDEPVIQIPGEVGMIYVIPDEVKKMIEDDLGDLDTTLVGEAELEGDTVNALDLLDEKELEEFFNNILDLPAGDYNIRIDLIIEGTDPDTLDDVELDIEIEPETDTDVSIGELEGCGVTVGVECEIEPEDIFDEKELEEFFDKYQFQGPVDIEIDLDLDLSLSGEMSMEGEAELQGDCDACGDAAAADIEIEVLEDLGIELRSKRAVGEPWIDVPRSVGFTSYPSFILTEPLGPIIDGYQMSPEIDELDLDLEMSGEAEAELEGDADTAADDPVGPFDIPDTPIQPIPNPPQTQVSLGVTPIPSSVSSTHTIGSSSCPQSLGIVSFNANMAGTLTVIALPNWLSVSISGNTASLSFNCNISSQTTQTLSSSARFQFTSTNGQTKTIEIPVTVQVNAASQPVPTPQTQSSSAVNNPPQLHFYPALPSDSTYHIRAGATFELTISASDPDSNHKRFLSISETGGYELGADYIGLPRTGIWTWTPSTNQIGTYSILIGVSDEGTPPLYDDKTIKITVHSASDPYQTITTGPAAWVSLPPAYYAAGSSVTVSGTDFTPNSSLTVEFDGSVVTTLTASATGSFTYSLNVPSTAISGDHSIFVIDGTGKPASAWISVT